MAKRILAVDDDPAFAEMLQVALSAKGYDVETCLQAPLAFRKIRELQPDLVTLDIMMPGRSGWEIVTSMRNYPQTAKIPIIITTGVHGGQVPDESLLLHGMRYEKLYKPFELEELYKKVEELIGATA